MTARRGVAFTPMETRLDVILQTAQLADELGYEAIAVPEGWGFDSTIVLTAIALRTRHITVVAGVLSVWAARHLAKHESLQLNVALSWGWLPFLLAGAVVVWLSQRGLK